MIAIKKHGELGVEMKNLAFCSGYNAPTIYKSTKEVFSVQGKLDTL
jgi:hypothetical protein